MSIEDLLRVTLIVGGLVFTTLSFVIIFTGKKIGEDGSQKNVIHFRGFEFKANNILMLIFISMTFCITPLVLPHLYSKPIFITGTVQDKDGEYLRGVTVILFMKTPGGKEKERDRSKTKGQGDFSFTIDNLKKGEEVSLRIEYQGEPKGDEPILPIYGKRITIDTSSEWSDN